MATLNLVLKAIVKMRFQSVPFRYVLVDYVNMYLHKLHGNYVSVLLLENHLYQEDPLLPA